MKFIKKFWEASGPVGTVIAACAVVGAGLAAYGLFAGVSAYIIMGAAIALFIGPSFSMFDTSEIYYKPVSQAPATPAPVSQQATTGPENAARLTAAYARAKQDVHASHMADRQHIAESICLSVRSEKAISAPRLKTGKQ